MKRWEELEPSEIGRVNDRVEKGPSPMCTADHQYGSRSHELGQVSDNPSLLLLNHPHQSSQENDIVVFQLRRDVHYIVGMEENPLRQVGVGEDEAESLGIGGRVDIVVVEHRLGEVVGGKDEGGKGEGARAHEGDTIRGTG